MGNEVMIRSDKRSAEMNTIYDLFQNYKGESFEAELVDFGEDIGFEVIGN